MLTALAICALAFGVLGTLAGGLALRTLGRLRRSVGLLGRGPGGRRESYVETTARFIDVTERTRQEFDQLSLSVLAALQRYETDVRASAAATSAGFTHEITAARADTGSQVEAARAEMLAELDRIRQVVIAELAQIHENIDQHRAEAVADMAEERRRLGEADAAAKDQLRQTVAQVERVIGGSLRRVALVRFDAFDDLSGRLSFALALLDGRGDGVTLTALSGRSEVRLYAKPINAGEAAVELSPEEREAVEAALAGK